MVDVNSDCKGSVSGHKYVRADACEKFCLTHREASTYSTKSKVSGKFVSEILSDVLGNF